jgi:hypothetical protein
MKTRIHVWHDQQGKIIAVGRPAKHMADRIKPMPAKKGHSVISIDVDDSAVKGILRAHVVDVATSQLKAKK